jgi:hypothetical protein
MGGGSETKPPARRGLDVAPSSFLVQEPPIYYIVSSESEAEQLTFRADQETAALVSQGGRLPRKSYYLAVDSPEKERLLEIMSQELNAFALEGQQTAQIIDLRLP